jgi:hypothetical protein
MNNARTTVASYLLEQVLGASSQSVMKTVPLPDKDSDGVIRFKDSSEIQAFHDNETLLPILQGTAPHMVFGTGVLHSPEHRETQPVENRENLEESEEGPFQGDEIKLSRAQDDQDLVDDFGLDESQRKRPSAFGITAYLDPSNLKLLKINISASKYEPFVVEIAQSKRTFYRQVPLNFSLEISPEQLKVCSEKMQCFDLGGGIEEFAEINIRCRKLQSNINSNSSGIQSVTAVLKHKGKTNEDLFNGAIEIELLGTSFVDIKQIRKDPTALQGEEAEIHHLFRHLSAFAAGHGVSTTWEKSESGHVTKVKTKWAPEYFSEVLDVEIESLDLSMQQFASGSKESVIRKLSNLVANYESWVKREASLDGGLEFVRKTLSERAMALVKRMRNGLDILSVDDKAFRAFQLMNEAMYAQQLRGGLSVRKMSADKYGPLTFPPLNLTSRENIGNWRPFQVGFLLLSIDGLLNAQSEDREIVDLIFFPTGGGKTEAYLGAAALTMLNLRLANPDHSGVDVLMRYTLRLLTVQQFERSAALLVALESLRRANVSELGTYPFSIGVWLGGKTTPNKRKDAIDELMRIRSGKEIKGSNPFVLSKCPNCGAEFGENKARKTVVGYESVIVNGVKSLRFVCGDKENCEFSNQDNPLPIWITDEDVYAERPSFLLGTVDKFARLAWEPNARSIFNISSSGERVGLPPSLIIQDELHLISGPLGSMVGLYEAVIEQLCSANINGQQIKPKIIASTATARRYQEQILNLYGRENTALFPQAIDRTNETFFGKVSRDENGLPLKGTMYLGLNLATFSTGQLLTSQVAAILSQAPLAWDGEEKDVDYYSTSMWFFNTLKELGQTLTLLQTTVVSLLNSMWRDSRIPGGKQRFLKTPMELTSRVSSKDVTDALRRLNNPASDKDGITTCLASSVMEVGVDVPRLGLLTILGQPKQTSQYIQVSGRVGRALKRGPGLIVMLYNPGRARDRSVYEHFLDYHQHLYANVEPLSVTPFTPQVLSKGLAGAIISLYRGSGSSDQTPSVVNESRLDVIKSIFEERLIAIKASDKTFEDFEQEFEAFIELWKAYEPEKWAYSKDQELSITNEDHSTALMRTRVPRVSSVATDLSIQAPNSMRSVDSVATLAILPNTYPYASQQQEDDGVNND